MKSNEFNKGIMGLRKVSLASKEKSTILSTITRYAEAHQPMTSEHLNAALARVLRSFFTTISWK